MKTTVDFQNGKLLPMILHFSIPAAISLLITAIYNIVDRIFVGNFVGTSALAGLSICFPLSYMMMAFGLNCSAGGSTLFSIFGGRNEEERMNLSFGNAFVLAVISELFLTLVLLLFADPILRVFGVTETSYEYAITYYRIVALGCVFQGLTQLFCDFVRVSGKPFWGMCVTGIGAITNIILDALFVAGFHWGVAGAAWATVIGQILSTVFGAWMVFGGRSQVQVSRRIFKLKKEIWPEIVSCGFAFWIAQMAMGFISLVYNSQLGRYGGDVAISVYAVIASIMTFVIMPASGITCIIWIIVMLFPRQILMAFGGSEEMFAIGVSGLRINFCITPILGFVMLATTFFQSLGKPVPSIVITMLRQVVFLVPFLYVLPLFLGINGIFYAQPISDALALVLSLFLVLREHRTLVSKS